MYCIRYITTNFLRRFKKSYLHQLVVSIGNLYSTCICKCIFSLSFFFKYLLTRFYFAGYSRMEREFNYQYGWMHQHSEIYTSWLDKIPRDKCVQDFHGGHRYRHMITNLVECINSVLKGIRNLPITALVRATYF